MTTDGKRVIGGIFPLVNSEGIILEIIVSQLRQDNSVVDWFGFWKEAMKFGWNPGSTKTKILCCIGEEFGPQVRESLQPTLELLCDLEGTEDPIPLLQQQHQRELETQRTRLIKQLKRVRSSDG